MVTLLAPKMFEHNSNNGSADVQAHEPQNDEAGLAQLSKATTRDLVQLFKMLGDDTRVRVLHYLTQRDELNVRTLCKLLGQSQPAVSHHLALLREDGIIACRRDGKHNFYRLATLELRDLLEQFFADAGNGPKQFNFEEFVLAYKRK